MDSKIYRLLRGTLLTFASSAAIALSAQVAIPLPFTPVPITLQTLVVLLSGALLGSRLGPLSVIVYIGLGMTGIPVFASGGAGLARLLGPTGGYLVGFAAASFVAGFLFENGFGKTLFGRTLAMLAASVLIYAFGLARLASFTGWDSVLSLGLYPFIAGDMLKIGLLTLLLPATQAVVQIRQKSL
ncbi:biotin transporter BioY [bacterium]|nr:biotin transporter BioY [bacterium]